MEITCQTATPGKCYQIVVRTTILHNDRVFYLVREGLLWKLVEERLYRRYVGTFESLSSARQYIIGSTNYILGLIVEHAAMERRCSIDSNDVIARMRGNEAAMRLYGRGFTQNGRWL